MQDFLPIKAMGRVRLEKYKNGQLIDKLEKNNLVVNSASDIIIKALSGDPRDIIWKSPVWINGFIDGNNIQPVEGGTYGWIYDYTPKKLVYNSNYKKYYIRNYNEFLNNDFIVVSPEIYSTDCINFIGIGLTNEYFYDNTNKIYNYTGTWEQVLNYTDASNNEIKYQGGSAQRATVAGSKVSFSIKATKVTLLLHGRLSNYTTAIVNIDGVQFTDILDEQSQTTVSQISTQYTDDLNTLRFTIDGLIDDTHTIEIIHSGVDGEILEFEGIIAKGLDGSLTTLSEEIPLQTDTIETFEQYFVDNETKSFIVNTREKKLVIGEMKVFYNGQEFADITGLFRGPNPGAYEFQMELDSSTNEPTGKIFISEAVPMVDVRFKVDSPFNTNYRRALVKKPKDGIDYPHFNYMQKKVVYDAEFEEQNPNYPITIKELALFTKPLAGHYDSTNTTYPTKMFSIANVEGFVKKPDEGLRVVWEITYA